MASSGLDLTACPPGKQVLWTPVRCLSANCLRPYHHQRLCMRTSCKRQPGDMMPCMQQGHSGVPALINAGTLVHLLLISSHCWNSGAFSEQQSGRHVRIIAVSRSKHALILTPGDPCLASMSPETPSPSPGWWPEGDKVAGMVSPAAALTQELLSA